mgnify:FL=1
MPQDVEKTGASTVTEEVADEEAAAEEETEEGKEGADTEEDEELDATPPKGPYNKDARWNKVYGGYQDSKAYKVFGTPAEVAKKIARAEIFEEELARASAPEVEEEPASDEEAAQKAKVTKVRKDLDTIYPELPQVVKMIGSYAESLERRARNETVKIAKEYGVDPKRLETTLSVLINEDADLYFEYLGDPRGTVREAAKHYFGPAGRKPSTERKEGADALRGKEKKDALPKTHKPSSGAPAGAGKTTDDKGPRNVKEAFKNINAKLKARGLA